MIQDDESIEALRRLARERISAAPPTPSLRALEWLASRRRAAAAERRWQRLVTVCSLVPALVPLLVWGLRAALSNGPVLTTAVLLAAVGPPAVYALARIALAEARGPRRAA
jgi:hypothetical protein